MPVESKFFDKIAPSIRASPIHNHMLFALKGL